MTVIFIALMLLSLPGPVVASDVLTSHPIVSFHRGGAAYAFDAARRRLVIVGGADDKGTATTDILELSPEPNWLRPGIVGTPPPATTFEVAVYDSLRDRILVFTPASDGVWSLGLSTPMTWTVLHPSGTRPALSGAQIVYDSARDRVVGYGGFLDAGTDPAKPTIGGLWSLSLGPSPSWTALAAAGGAPPTRAQGAAIYDPVLDRMVVFGGFTRSGATLTELNDTWQLSFAGGIPTWNPIVAPGTLPAARHSTAAIFDRESRRLVLIGGIQNGSTSAADDVQWLDLDVPAWHPVETTLISRFGAAAAYDAAGGRVVLAGGLSPGPKTLGDTWQLLLGPVPGPMERLEPGGGLVSAFFTGYDPVEHRFAALAGVGPAFLSTIDYAWSVTPTASPKPANLLGAYHDFRTNTTWAFSVDSVFSTPAASGAAWTRKAILGPKPGFDYPNTRYFDAIHRRILVISWESGYGATWTSTPEFWSLTLEPSPTWELLATSTPLGVRETPAILDTRRNRLLFFGGYSSGGSLHYDSLGDLHALDLSTLEWSVPTTTGSPPTPRALFAAAYDSLRDRLVIYGGAQYSAVQGGVYYLSFDSSGAGAWKRRDPLGVEVNTASGGVVDLGLDRFFVGGSESVLELQWGPERAVSLTCPPPATWTTGGVLPLTFGVAQDEPVGHSFEWTIRSRRGWPGFPLHGFIDLQGTTPAAFDVGIPIPDTAAAGSNELTAVIADLSDPAIADSCATDLSGGGPSGDPKLIAIEQPVMIVRGALDVRFTVPGGGVVRLEAFDLAGRRVAWRVESGFGAGDHTVRLAGAGALRPGIYFLRLSQAGREVHGRALVVSSR